ncbi:hypothetical protein [Phreatobacter stygius]|uniref:Uncharacterized protein n=1 Tax=Phreatobacter stygius TaxID=1940610 RepID=A0A4D7BJ73_9HYPH|nr:hypothetical protein [Phreatobacter stygius]QCI67777.1 hypothetical protein E8M01_28265 [Phreatobacter stygius]
MSIASRPVLPLLSFAAATLVILGICLVSMILQPTGGPNSRLGYHDQAAQGAVLAINATAAIDTLERVLPDPGDRPAIER